MGRETQFQRCYGQGTSWKHKDILYQDNTRTMLLEKNGRKFSTKNTKHINVRYYFIKDRVETRDVVIEHCPKEEMLGDHFKKPLQVVLFRNFREEIMNIPDDLDMGEMVMNGTGFKKGVMCKLHNETHPGCLQECAGDCDKAGRNNGSKEFPDGGTNNGTYNAVILEKGERSRAVRS